MKINLDVNKKYKFLDDIQIVKYKNYFLIICASNAKWLVAKNQVQVDFFNTLLANSIKDALANFCNNIDDCKDILIQIEAKKFCQKAEISEPAKKIQLHLTNKCNLCCPHCYMNAGENCENELSTKEILDALKEFACYGFNQLALTGGEVCMRDDLLQIVKGAKQNNYRISILTNGTLWKKEEIKEIAKYVSNIQISIDGFCENTNAKVRGKGNFEKALCTVENFIQNKIATSIAVTPVEVLRNPSLIEQYANFAKDLLRKYKNSKLFSISFNGNLMDGRDIKYTKEQKALYLELVEEIYKLAFAKNCQEIIFIDQNNKNKIAKNCSYGSITISSTGYIYFCSKLINQKSSLNLKTTSTKKIAQLSAKISKSSVITNITPCSVCALRYICGGDCRVLYIDELKNTCDFYFVQKQLCRTVPCTKAYKEEFYELMINTNKYLYS